MRLLHIEDDGNISLVESIEDDIPRYAILSHTWGFDSQEVSYQDLVNGTGREKRGRLKINFCAEQARKDNLSHFWVDTCCIDKSSSAELTESINSMFRWYKEAVVCYVFLEDLPPNLPAGDGLQHCRWFSRGWTLQELIAPEFVRFYGPLWEYIGTKRDNAVKISEFTNIPMEILYQDRLVTDYSIAARMSWASKRTTKRREDMAYCLLGIFDVNMPLIYGEGDKAFRRLQEEIIKRDNDLTIFAWDSSSGADEFVGVFASSPMAFADRGSFSNELNETAEFSLTNKGLYLTGEFDLRPVGCRIVQKPGQILYVLFLGKIRGSIPTTGGILLRKVGPRLFCRVGGLPMVDDQIARDEIFSSLVTNSAAIFIGVESRSARHVYASRLQALRFPLQEGMKLLWAAPTSLWDRSDSIFLKPRSGADVGYPCLLAVEISLSIAGYMREIIIFASYRGAGPVLRVFLATDYPREKHIFVEGKAVDEGIAFSGLKRGAAPLLSLGSSLHINFGGDMYRVSFGTHERLFRVGGMEIPVQSVEYEVCKI